ncbi:hypothetical protein C9374_012718 [Naegleria lovaniensis]|uniref:Uncharacterized protein n=1 Tax=Naegleria lovaniensis TaxID=51637 RepID=A0AA88KQG9_NAELO|nr:uncharacterized protein C9374_012718 [Naegleria lovaniensis]KAG2392466.1 hypothetical protein C9374_012718 [Naegleria lovaniensis]
MIDNGGRVAISLFPPPQEDARSHWSEIFQPTLGSQSHLYQLLMNKMRNDHRIQILRSDTGQILKSFGKTGSVSLKIKPTIAISICNAKALIVPQKNRIQVISLSTERVLCTLYCEYDHICVDHFNNNIIVALGKDLSMYALNPSTFKLEKISTMSYQFVRPLVRMRVDGSTGVLFYLPTSI